MVRVTDDVFDALVAGAIDALPPEFARFLERVPVIVDAYPSPELFELVENAEELLGLFVGPMLEEWDSSEAPPETAVIYLFRRNLEDDCRTRAELREQGTPLPAPLLHSVAGSSGGSDTGTSSATFHPPSVCFCQTTT